MDQPHRPNPDNKYSVLESPYGGHYNFSGNFNNWEELRAWCRDLQSCFDDWQRGGMDQRPVVEYDKTTGEEVARGPISALYRSMKVFGIMDDARFEPVS